MMESQERSSFIFGFYYFSNASRARSPELPKGDDLNRSKGMDDLCRVRTIDDVSIVLTANEVLLYIHFFGSRRYRSRESLLYWTVKGQ